MARCAARLAGEAIWIVDDLADIREDWEAGSWSRPLWMLARSAAETPSDASLALRRVVEMGTVDAEARRLADRLTRLRELCNEYEPSFQRSIRAAVQAWLEELPD